MLQHKMIAVSHLVLYHSRPEPTLGSGGLNRSETRCAIGLLQRIVRYHESSMPIPCWPARGLVQLSLPLLVYPCV